MSNLDQLRILIDGLFQKPELIPYQDDYQQPIKRLISAIEAERGQASSPYLLDRLPHPTVFKVMQQTTMYYLDIKGNLYLPNNDNPFVAQLVGRFRGTAFEINGKVFPVGRKKVKIFENDQRFYVDDKQNVYETVFSKPTLVGGLVGHVDNTGCIRM